MKDSFKNILNYLAIFTAFSGAFTTHPLNMFNADFRLSYLILAIVFIFWIPLFKKAGFNKIFLLFITIITIFSVYNALFGKDSFALIAKQAAGITIYSFFFYFLIIINNKDLKKIFNVYLNIAMIVGLIGLIQEASYLLKFKPGYDFSGFIPYWKISISETRFLKINSIMPEPSGFSILMMPAFFVSVSSLINRSSVFLKKWQNIIIILATIFSFSVLGFIGISLTLLIIIFKNLKLRYSLAAIAIIFIGIFSLSKASPDFNCRIYDTIDLITGKLSINSVNHSSYALFSNGAVAFKSFKENLLIGSGLGSHQVSYDRFIYGIVDERRNLHHTNSKDACSLFLRLLSETGLFGLMAFLIFLCVCYLNKKDDKTGYFWVINNAILIFFILRLIRVGHYWEEGFFFFFWLYYFTKKNSSEMEFR